MSGSVEVQPPLHPEHAYIDSDGFRNADMEASVYEDKDGSIIYSDIADRRQPTAVVIALTAEGVEWLLEELDQHRDDRFVRGLTYARDLAKVIAWDRAAGR
jgi:hypothetical protein